MANFTIRYMRNEFQLSTLDSGDRGGYGYVEVLFIGVKRFASQIRGKKFFWIRNGERTNPFDDCIAYLGKLLQGKWITDEEYSSFVQMSHDAWACYDKSCLLRSATRDHESVIDVRWELVPYSWESLDGYPSSAIPAAYR